MSSRRDSRTSDEIRKQIHELNSTQMNCDIETLVGTRIRTTSQVTDEDAQIENDVIDQLSLSEEEDYLLDENTQLRKPDFSLAPLWIMTCVVAYIYGVTLGLYMCSK